MFKNISRDHVSDASPNNMTDKPQGIARWTGAAYLGIVLTGLFAEFFVRGQLFVPDDARQTSENIANSPGLFGVGIAADLCMVCLDVTVALGLYKLLAPSAPRLARAATLFQLVQSAVLLINLRNLTDALSLARQTAAIHSTTLAEQTLDAMHKHALGYDVGLIAFGLSCLVLGHLLRRDGLVPRLLSLGMSATGAIYLVGSACALFAPTLSATVDPLYGVAIIVEPAFAIWLIVKGLPASTSRHSTAPGGEYQGA